MRSPADLLSVSGGNQVSNLSWRRDQPASKELSKTWRICLSTLGGTKPIPQELFVELNFRRSHAFLLEITVEICLERLNEV